MAKIDSVKNAVLTGAPLKKKAEEIIQLVWPMIKYLKLVDSSALCSSKCYYHWFQIREEVREFRVKELAKEGGLVALAMVRNWITKVDKRWEYAMSDFLRAGYVLDPEFVTHYSLDGQGLEKDVIDSWDRLCVKHGLDLMVVGEELTVYWEGQGTFGTAVKACARTTSP